MGIRVFFYKKFEFDKCWFSMSSWLLIGLSIIFIDAVFIAVSPLSKANGLLLTAAVIALIIGTYFPISLWVKQHMNRKYEMTSEYWLPKILPILLSSQVKDFNGSEIEQQWLKILDMVYMPLHIKRLDQQIKEVAMSDAGTVLLVPSILTVHACYAIHQPSKGKRLFVAQDVSVLNNLIKLTELAANITQARVHSERLEKERLAKDIHDDLSVKMLSLLPQVTKQQRPIVLDTLKELRNLLNQLDTHEVILADALAEWRLESSLRLQANDIKFKWQVELQEATTIVLSSDEYSNIRRIIREALSNALKYMNNHTVVISIGVQPDQLLSFCICNYGNYLPVESAGTRGIRSRVDVMQSRVENMRGELQWKKYTDHFQLSFTVNLQHFRVQHQHALESTMFG